MSVRTLIIVLLATAAVFGCGRRGALEEPGAQPATATGAYVVQAPGASPLYPGAPAVATPAEQVQPAPRRRFFLDFLL